MKSVIEAFKHCYLRNYFNFKGVTGRRSYWLFVLIAYIGLIMAPIVSFITGDFLNNLNGDAGFLGKIGIGFVVLFTIALSLFAITLPIPVISATIRRLRDAGRSPYLFVWLRALPVILLASSMLLRNLHPLESCYMFFYYISYAIDCITGILLLIFLVKPSVIVIPDVLE